MAPRAFADRTRDLCDALLQEQQLLERQDDLQLTDQNMVLILMDLFGGKVSVRMPRPDIEL